MKNFKIYILVFCLAVVLTGCSFGLVKKQNTPETKKEPVVNNVANTSEKSATTTKTSIASSSDDVSNWKTYSNKDVGLEFKYPPTWPTLVEDYSINIKSEHIPGHWVMSLPGGIFSTASTIDSLPANTPNSEFMCPKELYKESKMTCKNGISANGVRYYTLEFYAQITGETIHDVFVNTNKTIVAFSFEDKNRYKELLSEYQKVFSSLKIIE
jgi:hypothetical protein